MPSFPVPSSDPSASASGLAVPPCLQAAFDRVVEGDSRLLHPRGAITAVQEAAWRDEVLDWFESGETSLVLDCEEVREIDEVGLGVLHALACLGRRSDRRRVVRVVNVPERIRRTLACVGLELAAAA